MKVPFLASFHLVGGTALALKYGHRKSIDLDLFTQNPFNHDIVVNSLNEEFKTSFLYEGNFSQWGIFCFIDNIKTDIIHYPHPLIGSVETFENIRLASDKDLIAMKIQAILGRGVKKDFWDIAELLKHYSLQEMIDFHKEKYPNQMLGISIPQALLYFEDAESSIEPISLTTTNWTEIKNQIKEKVNVFLK